MKRKDDSRKKIVGRRRAVLLIAASLAITAFLVQPSQSGVRSYKVIVNPSNPVSALPKGEISSLFLKKTTRWNDGRQVMAIDLPSDSAVRESFSTEVHGRSAVAIRNHWMQMVFSGRGVPPPESPESDVLRYVRANFGAIGYVPADTVAEGVKVVAIEP